MKYLKSLFAVKPRSELKEFYYFSALFSFASALIVIFEPIFFFKEGLSLSMISLYYFMHYVLYLILLPWGAKFAYKFGLERSISISMPVFVCYFLMLAILPKVPGLFWVSWIVLSIFKVLYWPAAHASLAKFGNKRNQGTELSWIFAVQRGAGVLGPLIGGVVATYFGFPILFVGAAALALFASVPLLKTKENYRPVNMSYWKPWEIMKRREYRKMSWGMLGWIENLVDLVHWPIFMFMMLGSVDKLGYLTSLNVLIMTMLGFFVGEISDRVPSRKILRLHLPFMIIGYLLRPLAATPWRIILTDALGKTSLIGVRLPMWHVIYPKAKRDGPLQYMTMIEMQLSIAKAVGAGILVVVFAMTSVYTGFVVAFILAAVAGLMYLLV